MLQEQKVPQRTLALSDILGIPDVISGVGVFIIIPHIGISRSLYVDTDSHTFTDSRHTMSLDLSWAADIS
jgi:hypothetical protein